MQICPMRWSYWQSQHCSQAEGQLTLCRWCPVSQRSGIHMHVVTKPNSPHWNLAGCWRSTANWLTFTGKSPTCTHNPAPDGAEFLLRKSRGRDQRFCQRQVACLFTHTRKRWLEVADDYKEACWGCFLLGTTRVFWIVSCQGVLSDMMVAGGLTLREYQRGKEISSASNTAAVLSPFSKIPIEKQTCDSWRRVFFFFFISLCKERAHLHLMLERAQPHVCDVNCFQLLVNKQLITTFTHVKLQLLVALEVITAAKEEFRQQSINSNRIQERDRTFIHRTTVQKSTVSCCN